MSGLSRISNRAYMNDASYRIMKYLEAKLTDADGKIDDEKYDKLFAIMTGNMSVQLIISKLDKMYEDLFDKQYDNAVKLLNENDETKCEVEDELVESGNDDKNDINDKNKTE